MVTEKNWEEFRETGLLWFVNTTLHMFGWALCYDTENKEVYPARCKFRGFSDEINSDGYKKVSQYLQENVSELAKEANE